MALCLVFIGLLCGVPTPHFDAPLSTVLYDRNGELLGATVAEDEQWRFPPQQKIAEKFALALTTFEDKRFYNHPGIDFLALCRAAKDNIQAGRVVSGASTLTMQVARLARPGSARTLYSKIVEALGALKLELLLPKQDILRLYTSHAPFGGNVVGVEAASWRYFGRDPMSLSWAEAATLAVLPNAPALIHPGRNRSTLKAKRDRLLKALEKLGHIDRETYDLATLEALPTRPHPIANHAPHLLSQHPFRHNAKHAGLTTLLKSKQIMLNQVIARHHATLMGNGIHNAAALILAVDTGEVVAYVGNVAKFSPALHHNHVDLVQARRSTGSVLKPILYTAMLRDGALMPDQLVPDIPTRIGGFAPMNSGKTFDGMVPASRALARSLNIPATLMLRDYGLDRFYAELESMGMSTLTQPASHYGLTLILGGSEATLWELTGIYAGLARALQNETKQVLSAKSFKPKYLREQSPDNLPTYKNSAPYHAEPGAIYHTMEALSQVNRPGLDKGWQQFATSRPIAWKTGTSFGYRDAWAIGVTPEYAVGVWVGNADGEGRAGLTGTRAAAPIMLDIFSHFEPGPWFRRPTQAMVPVEVCVKSGLQAGAHCVHKEIRDVVRTASETLPCGYCEELHLHPDENFQVSSACGSLHTMRRLKRFTLPVAAETFYQRSHPSYRPVPSYHPDCPESRSAIQPGMAIVYPTPNARIFVPRGLNGRAGKAIFEATHRRSDAEIFWHLDNSYIGTTQNFHQLSWEPSPGDHLLTLVDKAGIRSSTRFTVLEPGS